MSELAKKLIAENIAKWERGEDASSLDIGRCGLTDLAQQVPELFELTWLEELTLRNEWWDWKERKSQFSKNKGTSNRLTIIPLAIKRLSQLKILRIATEWSEEYQISDGLFWDSLNNLHSLNISSNRINDGLFLKKLPNLSLLDISNNQIKDGHFLKELTNLSELNLSGNQITNWSFLENMTHLTELCLSRNHLVDIRFLKKLTHLSKIDLERNQISDIHFLKKLTALVELNLRSNRIINVKPLQNLKALSGLNLSNNQIKDSWPLKNLTNLHWLDIGNNKLWDLHFLKKLTNLTWLSLRSNQIHDGGVLSDLVNLSTLSIGGNQIKNWNFLKNLRKVSTLDLGNSQINDGTFLKEMISLSILYLHENQISDLRFLEKLKNLSKIDLSNNQINSIDFLGHIDIPIELDLSNNQINDITPLLPFIKRGRRVSLSNFRANIYLENNPLTTPPTEIVKSGNVTVINWFAERSKQQFQNNEIKLILIGNSTAGKTSLSRYLREREYEEGQPTTHGIHNDRWVPEGRNLEINCWDFGGQEYYHATHRLFLSRNSVYALVWDAQTDAGGYCDTDIHYEYDPAPHRVRLEHFPHRWWLQNIRHYTQSSNPPVPVLLVQNKCARDEIRRVSSDLEAAPYGLLPEWLDNHIDISAAAVHESTPSPETRKWQRNFEAFEERLLDKLEAQLAHYSFAVYHRDIRDRVRAIASGENPVNEMSWTDFEAMCRDIESDAKMDLVQIYLRDITGDILYFDQNERLRHRVFLRPDWVCNRIYAILSRKVLEREGLFDIAWVQEALRCDEAEALDFVALMHEFQLVFAENDENGVPTGNYVAPQYLPDVCPKPDKLEAAKEYANLAHAFTLRFSDFLPKSHIARFVAHWGHKAKLRLFWKNGLLFQTDGCTALVTRIGELDISVDIQTGHPQRNDAMRRIFQSFLNLGDGEAGFAVAMDGTAFVHWHSVVEARQTSARQLPLATPSEPKKYLPLSDFEILLQPPAMTAKKIFISYAHADEAAMQELDKFLGPLERSGDIRIWTDRNILPGQRWKEEILRNLESADMILLLVSANFLASDFIHEEEIPRALQGMEQHGKAVIPIILNYCLWDYSPLASIQALPKDAQPIAGFPNPAQAWNEVARGILKRLQDLGGGGGADNGNTPPRPAPTAPTPTGGDINNSKNVVFGSSITAGGSVHIGDVHHHGTATPAGEAKVGHLSPSEKEGIERAIELKIKVINKLRETLALEDDPICSIRYAEQLRAAETELAELKAKLG